MDTVKWLMIMSFIAGYLLSGMIFVTVLAIITVRWYTCQLEDLREWKSATLETRLQDFAS